MRTRPAVLVRWLLGNLLVLAAAVLAVYALLQLSLLPRLRGMLEQAVRRELALPDAAQVEVELGSIEETLRGLLPGFHVDSPAAVIDDIPFQGLRFDARAVDFNMRQILRGEKAAISAVGSAGLTLRMSADELRARLVPLLEEEGISNVNVEFGEDSVTLSGRQDANMAASGNFYVTADNRVGFALTDFRFSNLNISVSNLTLALDDFLPALDLGGMYAAVVVDRLETGPEFIVITAHTESIDAAPFGRELKEVF